MATVDCFFINFQEIQSLLMSRAHWKPCITYIAFRRKVLPWLQSMWKPGHFSTLRNQALNRYMLFLNFCQEKQNSDDPSIGQGPRKLLLNHSLKNTWIRSRIFPYTVSCPNTVKYANVSGRFLRWKLFELSFRHSIWTISSEPEIWKERKRIKFATKWHNKLCN